jgi:hypothetical protein
VIGKIVVGVQIIVSEIPSLNYLLVIRFPRSTECAKILFWKICRHEKNVRSYSLFLVDS